MTSESTTPATPKTRLWTLVAMAAAAYAFVLNLVLVVFDTEALPFSFLVAVVGAVAAALGLRRSPTLLGKILAGLSGIANLAVIGLVFLLVSVFNDAIPMLG